MFVFTVLLKGGLNQKMFPVLDLFFIGVVVNSVILTLDLYPALYRASLYTGSSFSKTSLEQEMSEMRLEIIFGYSCFFMDFGWLELE